MQEVRKERPSWALTGAKNREKNITTSIRMDAESLEEFNFRLQEKLTRIQENEVRYEELFLDDAELVIVAYGTAARVAKSAIKRLRQEGLKVGIFRPISLWPFPEKRLAEVVGRTAKGSPLTRVFLVVEMNAGQMLHDVREAVGTQIPVKFLGRMGGVIPMPDEIEERARALMAVFGNPDKHLLQESGNGHRNQ
jgi:2-oxoglutarate ferredoxin oxidoreductase subunit alpha